MSFTYTQLKTAIQDYTDNTETTFVNNLDNFIKACEEKILKSVDLEFFRKNVTSTLTSSDKFLSVPDDYLASFSLQITTASSETFLLQKDVNFIQEAYPPSASTGVPKYYAIFDIDNFILAPTPNSAYTVELHYFYRPTSITVGAGNGTTWLSTNASNALLYGCLVEAYMYMKGSADLQAEYEKRYFQAISRLKNLGEADNTLDTYSSGQFREKRS